MYKTKRRIVCCAKTQNYYFLLCASAATAAADAFVLCVQCAGTPFRHTIFALISLTGGISFVFSNINNSFPFNASQLGGSQRPDAFHHSIHQVQESIDGEIGPAPEIPTDHERKSDNDVLCRCVSADDGAGVKRYPLEVGTFTGVRASLSGVSRSSVTQTMITVVRMPSICHCRRSPLCACLALCELCSSIIWRNGNGGPSYHRVVECSRIST